MTRIDQLPPDHWERTGARKRERNYQLQQTDPNAPTIQGEGLTFTHKAGAKLFAMELTFRTTGRPMRTTIRALNWRQAEDFARNRHPDVASITRLNTLPSHPLPSA